MKANIIRILFPHFVMKDLWVLCCIVAISVSLSYAVAYEFGREWHLGSDFQIVVFGVFSLALTVLVYSAVALAVNLLRRFRYWDATELMRMDPRPPVLYLRSFKSDQKSSLKTRGHLFETERGDEETLVRLLYPIGPVLTLGRAGDRFPLVATPRLVIKPRSWQPAILTLIEAAALIVIRAGSTPGLVWEMRAVFTRVPPERIWIFLSFDRASEVSLFRSLLVSLVRKSDLIAAVPVSALRGSVFMYFEKDWAPRLIASRRLSEYRTALLPWGLKEEDYREMLGQIHTDNPVSQLISKVKLGVGGLGWTPREASNYWRQQHPMCAECTARNRSTRELISSLVGRAPQIR